MAKTKDYKRPRRNQAIERHKQAVLKQNKGPHTSYLAPKKGYGSYEDSGRQMRPPHYLATKHNNKAQKRNKQATKKDYRTPHSKYQPPNRGYQPPEQEYQTQKRTDRPPGVKYKGPQTDYQAPRRIQLAKKNTKGPEGKLSPRESLHIKSTSGVTILGNFCEHFYTC